jgi:Sulfotransferase domain
MSIRKKVPEPLQDLGRDGYVRLGAATASLRMRPNFILIGAQRCGSTSLFRALMAHPQVLRPAFHKGVNYFDLNYYRGERWYRGHFPLTGPAHRKTDRHGGPAVFEASGYYFYHPFALERLARDLPDVKLVALMREPTERAFSAYKHEHARGFETESFERALELEDERLSGEIEKMRDDPAYESLSHRHHSYRHRGNYAEQLERVFKLFPREQVHIIGSEAFFREPAAQYQPLLAFLGLRPFQPASFGQYNGHRSEPMPPGIRRWLEDYYVPHNERLAGLLDQPVPWQS